MTAGVRPALSLGTQGRLLQPRRGPRLVLAVLVIAAVVTLLGMMLFSSTVRESPSAGSAVGILLGATTALLAQLFVAPAIARQTRREERAELAMLEMRAAIVKDLGPALALLRKVTAQMAAVESRSSKSHDPAFDRAATPAVTALREQLVAMRDPVVAANAAVWIHFAPAADAALKRDYDELMSGLQRVLELDGASRRMSGFDLDRLTSRCQQLADQMVQQLTLQLTGSRGGPPTAWRTAG